jgi:hypothetical protein
MDGRDFLPVAQSASRGPSEAYWRTAVSRAYYAVMLELRDAFIRWGLSAPPQPFVHVAVRQRVYTSRDADMKGIGRMLDVLRDLRKLADYDTSTVRQFKDNAEAVAAVQRARDALALLDAIQADQPRRDTIAAEIRAVFP